MIQGKRMLLMMMMMMMMMEDLFTKLTESPIIRSPIT